MFNFTSFGDNLRRWLNPTQAVEESAEEVKDQNYLHVALVDKRNLLGGVDADAPDKVEVYLPKSKELVIEIKPAQGQPRRNPASYQVKVMDQERWCIRTLIMRATQPLVVVQ